MNFETVHSASERDNCAIGFSQQTADSLPETDVF